MSKPSKHFNLDDDGFAKISFVNNSGLKAAQFTLDSTNLSVTLTTNPSFDRRLLVLKNESEDGIIVYVGNEDVAAGDGIPLYPGDILQIPLAGKKQGQTDEKSPEAAEPRRRGRKRGNGGSHGAILLKGFSSVFTGLFAPPHKPRGMRYTGGRKWRRRSTRPSR
jgi:hypothetical protein